MEALKKPIWRVPLVLGALGLVRRCLSYVLGFIWARVQIAQGPGPDGAYTVSTGHMSEVAAVISFLLFWWAGWKFVRGLTRREIFWSASIMALVNAALLAAEQIGQAVTGSYPMWVYRLWVLAEGSGWVNQLFLRLFLAVGSTSNLWVISGVLAPYLYLVFGKKSAPQ